MALPKVGDKGDAFEMLLRPTARGIVFAECINSVSTLLPIFIWGIRSSDVFFCHNKRYEPPPVWTKGVMDLFIASLEDISLGFARQIVRRFATSATAVVL